MERSRRTDDNHALELAIAHANGLGRPTLVVVGLDPDGPEGGERSLRFVLEGLRECASALRERGVGFVARAGAPPAVVRELAVDASLVVCDRGYLRHQRAWREEVATTAGCPVIEVESDVVVPVDVASQRLEVAARTLRPKLHRQLERFLAEPPRHPVEVRFDGAAVPEGLVLDRPAVLARTLSRGRGPAPVGERGGARQARRRLETFVTERLPRYADERRLVHRRAGSELSAYLHFGQLSALRVALRLRRPDVPPDPASAFLEQLVVRRELSVNFVTHQPDYDRYAALPAWARTTLAAHRGDPREALYDDDQLLAAATHDPYFNAAMLELREAGTLHPTMRMYWGKRLLAWTADPEQGFERTLRFNNGYLLDGHDPNSYAGVAWCYGLHDRPFPERAVFGTVRSMTAAGLERKHDPRHYVAEVTRRVGAAPGTAP